MAKIASPLQASLKEAREALKTQKALVADLASKAKAERVTFKAAKVERQVAKAKARLEALLSKQVGPVGAKAKKAARRASRATVVTGAAAAALVG